MRQARWRTISIYLPDANPRWLKICEITNSIVKAIYIPRNQLDQAYTRDELKETWIYFLFWEKQTSWKYEVYIWEAESLVDRIKQHNRDWKKDFFHSIVCVISTNWYLNKAHVKYLEYHVHKMLLVSDNALVNNSIVPAQVKLSEQEVNFSLEFFDDVELVISSLWFQIFEKYESQENIIFCSWKEAKAKWIYSEEWLKVYKWSTALKEEAKSAWKYVWWIRKLLIEWWVLIDAWDVYEFNENYIFSSPSSAAMAILWRSANWRTERKNKQWDTLDKIIRK